jgi:general secretion pathway protein F
MVYLFVYERFHCSIASLCGSISGNIALMPSFRYRALASGEMVRGVVDGTSAAEIATSLQRRGLIVLGVAPAPRGLAAFNLDIGGSRLSNAERAEATRELATMLGAGQDLDRALRFMVEGAASPRAAAVLGRVRDRVRDGAPLATALAREPRSFPLFFIGMVRAGEAGGTLAATLERIAILMERSRGLSASIQAAMIYPAVLVVAAVSAIILLLTQVLPQFVPLFAENGVPLPPSTAFLLGAGQAVSSYGIYALILLVAAGFAAAAALRKPGPRRALDRALLTIPVAGGLLREILAARFSRTLGMLLSNGVPLLAALTITQDVLGNALARDAVADAASSAKSGGGLSRALAGSKIFPDRLIHLLRLGEDTAQLGPLALRAADIHEERTRLGLQRLVALLVPAITILMGAAVAGIVSSLLLAMLSLNDIAQ